MSSPTWRKNSHVVLGVDDSMSTTVLMTRQKSFVRSLLVALAAAVTVTHLIVLWDTKLLNQFDVSDDDDNVRNQTRFTVSRSASDIASSIFDELDDENSTGISLFVNDDDEWDVGDVAVGDYDEEERDDEQEQLLNDTLTRRGLNVLTAFSGCHVAAWIYEHGPPKFKDCYIPRHQNPQRRLNPQQDNFAQYLIDHVRTNDTIYVNIKGLQPFVQQILPLLPVPIVLISGSYFKTARDRLDDGIVTTILQHDYIIKWLCHNINTYISSPQLQYHDKLSGWPYGVQPQSYTPYLPDPLPLFKDAFWRHHYRTMNNGTNSKTRSIMAGYISAKHNPERSKIAPSGPMLNLTEYYDAIADHRYIISPNGDRPECYRHYEAIGLGTIPLTELDPILYSHLSAAPVVYGLTNFWNLTEDGTDAIVNLTHSRSIKGRYRPANRRLITEEYWMEYVNQLVGRSLRWSDVLQGNQQAYYADFKALP